MNKNKLPPARDGYLDIEMGTVWGLKKEIETLTGGKAKRTKNKTAGRKKH